ncbi:MAG: ATP12 family protein [Pseudomonadota bacterium]
MSGWTAKRFWKEATVVPYADAFAVRLDDRPVRTPAKNELVVPTQALARAIAEEWDAQEAVVRPQNMPMTRAANAAIDKVGPQHSEVASLLAAYGDADLICYRADAPDSLVSRQSEAWDPLLEWINRLFDIQLCVITGVMHVPQKPEHLDRLSARVHELDKYTLTAFHDLVGLSGSLAIGFAALEGWKSTAKLWSLSRVDEVWQQELWGEDEEAIATAAFKEKEFGDAMRFHRFLHDPD